MFGNLGLDLAYASERLIPARFELRRHQPVLRISRVVLSECPVGGIARRLEVAQKGILNLVALAGHITVRLDGGGNGACFDHAEQCLFDRVIDPQATESNAAWLAIVEQTAPAGIARNVMIASGVPVITMRGDGRSIGLSRNESGRCPCHASP